MKVETIVQIAIGLMIIAVATGVFAAIIYAVGEVEERNTEPKAESTHLPSLCRHLYATGQSMKWRNCIGVGYVEKTNADSSNP